VRFGTIILLGLLGLSGCKRPPPSTTPWAPDPAPGLGPVVARVGDVPIFSAEVADQAARTGKPPRAALIDLIDLHLLAERFRSRWPPQEHDPEARALEREMLVQRLLERDFEATTRPQDMPDEAVRALYEGAIDTFVHPRLVDVAVLVLTPGKKASAAVRAEARKTMTELAALVALRREHTAEDLQALGADEKWRNRKVQYFRFLQAGDKPYSARFGAEVSKLKTLGETSPLIEDEYGFYIACYLGDRPPQNQTFEQVKNDLREGFYVRWRQAKFLEFTQQIGVQHEAEIHAGALTAASGS
jgi:hypothetical protein